MKLDHQGRSLHREAHASAADAVEPSKRCKQEVAMEAQQWLFLWSPCQQVRHKIPMVHSLRVPQELCPEIFAGVLPDLSRASHHKLRCESTAQTCLGYSTDLNPLCPHHPLHRFTLRRQGTMSHSVLLSDSFQRDCVGSRSSCVP